MARRYLTNRSRFLFARIQMDQLRDCLTPARLKASLRGIPSGPMPYAEMYDKTLKIVEDQSEIKRNLAFDILAWIFYSKRTLTTRELLNAVAIQIGVPHLNQENMCAMSTIRSVCAGLVVEDQDGVNVQLVHHTAKEFMRDRQPKWLSDRSGEIARACVTYLSFDAFSSGACPSDESYDQRLVENPFFDYAAWYWADHVRENSLQEDDVVMTLVSKQGHMEAIAQAKMSRILRTYQPGYSQKFLGDMKAGHLIARFGLHITLGRLLKNGMHPDVKDKYGRTALYHAAMEGHMEVIKTLLQNKANVNAQGGFHGNALRAASHQGHLEAVRLLLDHKADVDLPAADSFTAIRAAIVMDRQDVVRLLLERGAKVNLSKPGIETPLITSINHDRRDIAKILLEIGANPDGGNGVKLDSPLVIASRMNRLQIVRLLLEAGAAIDKTSGKRAITPLVAAGEKGHLPIVKVLLEYRPNVNMLVGDTKMTALLLASGQGFVNQAQTLLDAGAFVNLPAGTKKMTPLIAAAEAGRIEVVKLLIERHADVNARDTSLMSALHHAATKGHIEIVKVLVQAGSSISNLDSIGRDAIMCASGHARGHSRTHFPTTVQYLLDHRGACSKEKKLYTASWLDRADLIANLLSQGVNINAQVGAYGCPLYAASFQGHRKSVHLLLAHKADVNGRGDNKKTPLMIAIEFRFLDLVRKFISAGSDVNAVDSSGRTALHIAAEHAANMDLWNILVDAGCSLKALDNQGCGPLFYARRRGCTPIVEDILGRLKAAEQAG